MKVILCFHLCLMKAGWTQVSEVETASQAPEDPRLAPTGVTMGLLRGPPRGLVAHPPARVSRPSLVAGGQPTDRGSLVGTRRKVRLAPDSKPGSCAP